MNDDQMVQLLRDVPLPAEPMDRYAAVAGRRRRADGRRLTVVGASLAVVALVATVSVVTFKDSTRPQSVSSLLSAPPNTARVVTTVTMNKNTQTFETLVDFKNHTSVVRYPGGVFEARQIGDDTWISGIPGLPKGKRWLHSRSKLTSSFLGYSSFSDPTRLLETIRKEGGDVREVGDSDVDGVPTTRYEVDTPGDDETFESLDVFIDEQGRVRRIVVDGAGGGDVPTLRAQIDLKDFGLSVVVTAPPAAEVAESNEVGSSFGSGSGSQGTTTCTPASKDGSTSDSGSTVFRRCTTTGTTLLTGEGSAEDKARFCAQFRAMPLTEEFTQEKKDQIVKAACS